MKSQSIFLEKNQKNIVNLSSAILASIVVNVKILRGIAV